MVTQRFHLGHILSITTEILCPVPGNEDYPMRTVREILNFMANEPDGFQTFVLPRIGDECRPYLLEQFPQLAAISAQDITGGEGFEKNMPKLVAQYGEYFDVRPIHPEDHQDIDPQVELAMLAPHLEIITIEEHEE